MITPIIDTSIKDPVYTQIYKYIKKEIETGHLSFKEKLPSTRILASHLQVSRNTIDMAYGQLIDEGYIEAFPKRGIFCLRYFFEFNVHSRQCPDSAPAKRRTASL